MDNWLGFHWKNISLQGDHIALLLIIVHAYTVRKPT
jgi:hypothetical protein